ncbi:MAG: type II secretion system protein [Candidatus Portnoybacteria bacterium]|nr:type II secretion system protein [Candidatus Portnoybacteria bacterium]
MRITKQGFTLIELLVVIAIIGLLASIVLFSVETIRNKGRDTRRVTDMKVIYEALSFYYNENYLYPDSGGVVIEINGTTDAMSIGLLGTEAMQAVPIDPLNVDRDGVTYKYYYQSLDSRKDYELTYYLETNSINGRSQGINIINP